jgi:hypothetical protein
MTALAPAQNQWSQSHRSQQIGDAQLEKTLPEHGKSALSQVRASLR